MLFDCYTSEYIQWSLSFILPVILLIGIIIPAFIVFQIFKGRRKSITRKKYIFMTGEYKPEAWFWEFLKMYLKLLIMCCLTFYEYDIPNKVKNSSTFYLFLYLFFWFLTPRFYSFSSWYRFTVSCCFIRSPINSRSTIKSISFRPLSKGYQFTQDSLRTKTEQINSGIFCLSQSLELLIYCSSFGAHPSQETHIQLT